MGRPSSSSPTSRRAVLNSAHSGSWLRPGRKVGAFLPAVQAELINTVASLYGRHSQAE